MTEEAATTSPATEILDEAARNQLPPPEEKSIMENAVAEENAARDPVRKPEQSAQSIMQVVPHTIAPVHAHRSNVVSPEAFKQAEQSLAAYFGAKLDPALTKGLLLTMSNILSDGADGKTGGTNVKLCFAGPMIEANFAEMSREVAKALSEHPVIGSLLAGSSTLAIDQADSAQKGQMLHLHLPNLSAEKYVQLIQSLATNAPAHTMHVARDEAISADAVAQVDVAAQTDSPVTITEPEIKAPVIKEPVLGPDPKPAGQKDEQPAASVEAPVVKMGVQEEKQQPLGMTA